jgi:hypothetical protein
MSSNDRESAPRVFLSLTSPARPAQKAFVASLVSMIARHDMTPVRTTGSQPSTLAPLEVIRQVMETCSATIVIAMARNHVIEGLDYVNGENGRRYQDRYLTTEWVQIEGALAYQLGHPILVLREDLVHPAGLLDPTAGGLTVSTFSLRRSATDDVAKIAADLLVFRARLANRAMPVPRRQ